MLTMRSILLNCLNKIPPSFEVCCQSVSTKTVVRTCTSASTTHRNGILKSDYGNVPLPNQDICSYMFSRWEKWPKKEAFECVTTGRKMTYSELLEYSLRWGAALQRIVPDSLNSEEDLPRVAIMSQNVIEYGPLVFGTLAAGWVFTTVNWNYKLDEMITILKSLNPKVLIAHASLEDVADEAIRSLKMSIPVFVIGPSKRGKPNVQEIIEDPKNEKINFKEVNPSAPSFILHSGGTTGPPKGVVIPHSSVTNNVTCFTDPRIFAFGGEDYPNVPIIASTPFYHSYGLHAIMMLNLSLGSKLLVLKEYDPLEYGNIISKHKVQFLYLVPTLLNFIIKSGHVTRKHLSSVKGVIIAAAPILLSLANAFREMTSPDVIFQEGFGSTEVLCTHLTPKDFVRIGFCGKLIPNTEAKIIDVETRQILGPNQPGEICLRCPFMMSHYLHNPKATAETIDEEGWLLTGDVATYTEDGYFNIIDRKKDLIKVNSHQVSPSEIENVLLEHEKVEEAAVIGIPDERGVHRPRAYVILKGAVTEEELIKHVESRLCPHQRLTGGVCFVQELPKSQAGKILRRELEEIWKKNLQ